TTECARRRPTARPNAAAVHLLSLLLPRVHRGGCLHKKELPTLKRRPSQPKLPPTVRRPNQDRRLLPRHQVYQSLLLATQPASLGAWPLSAHARRFLEPRHRNARAAASTRQPCSRESPCRHLHSG